MIVEELGGGVGGILGQFMTYTKVKGYAWGFRKYMLDFLKFLVNLYFTDQNLHGPEFLKNTLHITCKLMAPHFSDFLHSCLVCILSKHESNRKNNNHHYLFLHVNFKDQNFQKILLYLCFKPSNFPFKTLSRLLENQFWDFLGYKNFYET